MKPQRPRTKLKPEMIRNYHKKRETTNSSKKGKQRKETYIFEPLEIPQEFLRKKTMLEITLVVIVVSEFWRR